MLENLDNDRNSQKMLYIPRKSRKCWNFFKMLENIENARKLKKGQQMLEIPRKCFKNL